MDLDIVIFLFTIPLLGVLGVAFLIYNNIRGYIFIKNMFSNLNIEKKYKLKILRNIQFNYYLFKRNPQYIENKVLEEYAEILLDNAGFYNYMRSEYSEIKKTLLNKNHKYRGILVQNLLYISEAIKEPLILLSKIKQSNMLSPVEKENDRKVVEKQIKETLYKFYEMYKELDKEYENSISTDKTLIKDNNVFSKLNAYNDLIDNIIVDFKNKLSKNI